MMTQSPTPTAAYVARYMKPLFLSFTDHQPLATPAKREPLRFPPCHGQAWRTVASSRLPADNAAKQRQPLVFLPSSLAFISPPGAALPTSRQPCWWNVSNPTNQKGRSIRPPLPNVYSGRTPIMASLLRTLHFFTLSFFTVTVNCAL